MKNKTAVQIFFEDLCHLGYIEYPDDSLVQDRLNLALEMEKHQRINHCPSCGTAIRSIEIEEADYIEFKKLAL